MYLLQLTAMPWRLGQVKLIEALPWLSIDLNGRYCNGRRYRKLAKPLGPDTLRTESRPRRKFEFNL